MSAKGNKGSNIAAFKSLLTKNTDAAIPMVMRRVVVKEVNWEEKTMTATDLIDDLDHFDIRLGIGAMYRRPTVGSLAIIAIIGKETVDTILMECASIDQLEVTDQTGFKVDLNEGKMTVNGDAFSGIVKAPELKSQIDKNTEIIKQIQQAFMNWTPVPNDGGAALKTAVTALTSLQRADLSNIENELIKHG
jgi:hypothetical protein